MQKTLLKKGFTFIIVVLFIGITYSGVVSGMIDMNKKEKQYDNTEILQNRCTWFGKGDNNGVKYIRLTRQFLKSGIIVDEFEYERSWSHNSLITGQQGIASDDHWHFFICDGRPTSDDGEPTVVVAELDNATGTFVSSSINGISSLEIPYHASDPFCDSDYLMVPWSNYPTQSQARCYVYWLSNLTELPNSPYDLREGGYEYLPGVSTGAYDPNDEYHWFATYADGNPQIVSHAYKFSFKPDTGFTYIEKHSLGKTEVQGIEIYGNKLYFIRKHGQDDYVWSINMITWDSSNLDRENLAIESGNLNGPYEGITFDTSNPKKCTAYFGFGDNVFEAFNMTIYNHYNLKIEVDKGNYFLKIPILITNIGIESAINISWTLDIDTIIGWIPRDRWAGNISEISHGKQHVIIIEPVFGFSFARITAMADVAIDVVRTLIFGPIVYIF